MTFHWYGFFIGLGMVAALLAGEFIVNTEKVRAEKVNINKKGIKSKHSVIDIAHRYWLIAAVVLLGGVVGARAWHVITDFHVYKNELTAIFLITNGGLSIIGGLVAGFAMLFGVSRYFSKESGLFLYLLDLAVFVVPIGQIIGRLGNWINQELYGLPASVPWGIFIESAYRLPGFEQYTHFHPLFAYEMILLFPFFVGAWYVWWYKQVAIGNGWYFLSYIVLYGLGRFFLEFLRIDKAIVYGLGVNQVLSLLFACTALVVLYTMIQTRKQYISRISNTMLLLVLVLIGTTLIGGSVFLLLFFGTPASVYGTNSSVINRFVSKIHSVTTATYSTATNSTPSVYATLLKMPDRSMVEINIISKMEESKLKEANSPDKKNRGTGNNEQTGFSDQITNQLTVEVVNTPQSIELGLGNRENIGSDGMLFVLPTATQAYFWMKGMQFDLDLIWIVNEKIIGITSDVPAPSGDMAQSVRLPTYPSPGKVDLVLEVPAGFSRENGILVGDAIQIK